ncbi:MAG: hypothetical protein AB7E42_02605 [Anaerotignaceae bacterium]
MDLQWINGTDDVAEMATKTNVNFNALEEGVSEDIATAKTEAITETQTWTKGTFSNPNLLPNGDFQVWQRGTVFTNVAGVYTADRWLNHISNSNVSRQVNTSPTPCEYSLLLEKQDGLYGYARISQILESYSVFSGLPMTLSLYARGTGGFVGDLRSYLGSTDKSNALTSEWQKIEYTVASATFGSDTYQKGVSFFIETTAIGQGVELAAVKLELGSVATPFVPRPYGEELALCKRYYQTINVNTRNRANSITPGTLSFYFPISEMRISPTMVMHGTEETDYAVRTLAGTAATGFTYAISALTTPNQFGLNANKASHGLPDGVFAITTSDGYIALDAEL